LFNRFSVTIDKEHLEKQDTYDFLEAFLAESDVCLSVRIVEGNKNEQEVKESVLAQVGCFLLIAISGVVAVVGVVTSFKWLAEIFD
jgi:hypothetical protein